MGGGRPGNGLAEEATDEFVPHDLVCDTEEREDCAVDDLSLRTRVDFAVEGAGEDIGLVDVTVAQPSVKLPLGMALGPGREG